MLNIPEYNPNFFTNSLRNILTNAGINPDKVAKAKIGKSVRFVSPLGHYEGTMAMAIDMCILRGVVTPKEIIKALDEDPTIADQRKKFLRTKDEINMPDLLAKINGHIGYYAGRNFDAHFTKTFQVNDHIARSIRKAARAYIDTTWKPGLKEYKKVLNASIVKVAKEVVMEENGTIALKQGMTNTWMVMSSTLQSTVVAQKETIEEVPQDATALVDTVEDSGALVAEKKKCAGVTKAGLPCKGFAHGASEFCRVHTVKEQ